MAELRQTEPLDMSGIKPAALGTVAWLLALVAMIAAGQLPPWWMWTAVTGVLLGLFGIAVVLVQRVRRQRSETAGSSSTGSSPNGSVSNSSRN